jgi:hypothetical protein
MSNARNVGGVSARSGRRLALPTHYLTARESAGIARRERAKAEARGIFRRWNGRKLTAEQQALADLALKRTAAVLSRAKARAAQPAAPAASNSLHSEVFEDVKAPLLSTLRAE